MRINLIISFLCLSMSLSALTVSTDICIYGGTSAGIISAVSAHRLGKKSVIVEPSNALGGLTTNGLGNVDLKNKFAVTGIARDFYRRMGDQYGQLEMWRYEPHKAERVFNELLLPTKVVAYRGYALHSVVKENGKIIEIHFVNLNKTTDDVLIVKAKMFIDASYEGDLLAKAGISYMLGREDNALYKETHNGVQLLPNHQFPDGISPYLIPGDSSSGLCYGVSPQPLQAKGKGDTKLQAYNFRLCLTQNKKNFIPITAPIDYDPLKYELLKRIIEKRTAEGEKQSLATYLQITTIPNGKADINSVGPFSTDFVGENWDYIEADWVARKQIINEHVNYSKGLLYFLGNDSSVPDDLRSEMLSWGYAKDEFTDNAGFPRQINVREGRRMIGEYVMTEHNCVGKRKVKDGIGSSDYTMGSHHCQRVIVDGMVQNEGEVNVDNLLPCAIPYRSLIPSRKECTNLIVPVAISASHIAYRAIGVEPIIMTLAQTATVAASMAIDANVSIQKIKVKELNRILLENPLLNGKRPELMVDNSDKKQVKVEGDWQLITMKKVSNKMDYLMINGDSSKPTTVKFFPKLPKSGIYTVYFYCPDKPNDLTHWAESVNLYVFDGDTTTRTIVSQKENSSSWVNIGVYELISDAMPYVMVESDKSGVAIADAVLFIPSNRFEESD